MPGDRFRVERAYRDELDDFASWERSRGAAPGTVSQHRWDVVRCIAAMGRGFDPGLVTADDLSELRSDLDLIGERNPVSAVRVFAVFLSRVTGTEPLVDTGAYGRPTRTGALLLGTAPDGGRRTMGTRDDRREIECRYGELLDAFCRRERESGLAPSTVTVHRKRVCASIYCLERHGGLTLDAVDGSDVDRLERSLADFGVPEVPRYVSAFVSFVSSATGRPPLRDLGAYGESNPRRVVCGPSRFADEIGRFRAYSLAGGTSVGATEDKVSMVRASLAALDREVGPKPISEYGADDVRALGSVLGATMSDSCADRYVRAFCSFLSYFGNDGLTRERGKGSDRTAFGVFTAEELSFRRKLDDYVDHMRRWRLKERTVKGRVSAITVCYRMLADATGGVSLEDVGPADIRMLRDLMCGYSDSTVRTYLNTFGWFLEDAVGRNPYRDAHLRFSGEVRRQFIFADEWVKLWDSADVTGRLVLSLGATMGLRKSEILGIGMGDIGDGRITVRGKGQGPNGKVETLPMTDLVRASLDGYLAYREEVLSSCGDRSQGRLLINPFHRNLGRPMGDRTLQTVLEGLAERSGVSFTAHSLRRLYATTLDDAGLDLDTIRRMMRHSSAETTLRCYLHADPRKISAAVDAVNGAFAAVGS